MLSKHTIVITALLLASISINAQEEKSNIPMITDRPDATESPTVIPHKSLQVETGFAYQNFKNSTEESDQVTYNTTLLRYGLLENLELRLGLDIDNIETRARGIDTKSELKGTSPLLIGAKVGIAEEKGWLPEIGLLGHLSHPISASDDFESRYTGVDFRFSFAHTLSENSSFSYNLGAEWGGDNPEAAYIYTFSYGLSVSEKVGLYAELYGDFPERDSANHSWDAGITYLISPIIQLDATVGTGINTDQKLLISTGISFRLPQ